MELARCVVPCHVLLLLWSEFLASLLLRLIEMIQSNQIQTEELSWLMSKQFILGLANIYLTYSHVCLFLLMSSRQNPLHLSTFMIMVIVFWGLYRFRVYCAIVAFGGRDFSVCNVLCTPIQGLSQLQMAARNRH